MQYLVIIHISTENYLEHPASSCKKRMAPVERTPGRKFYSSAGKSPYLGRGSGYGSRIFAGSKVYHFHTCIPNEGKFLGLEREIGVVLSGYLIFALRILW